MATLRKMPSGMVSGPVTINWTTEERIQKAKECLERAEQDIAQAKAQLKQLEAQQQRKEDDSDRLDIFIHAAKARVEDCEESKKRAQRKLEELNA